MRIFGLNITAAPRALALVPDTEQRGVSPENPNFSLSDPAILDALGIGDNASGVNPGNAMEASAVFSCVRVIAESLAQLPIRLYRKTGKKREVAVDHPVGRLLAGQPNPVMTWATWFEQQQTQLSLWGNCYSHRIFDTRSDETIALYPLGSSMIQPGTRQAVDVRGYPALEKIYRMGTLLFDVESVVHVPLLSLDGIKGLSPITLNRMGISLALSQQQFSAKLYSNGARPAGVLEHPTKLSADASTRIRENWTAIYAGSANAGKTAILEEGMKFNPLTMPLEDAQFIETVRFTREQIAAIFRVPPHMIGNLERATFSNIEQQSLEFAVYTLGPYLVKWEQAFAHTLLLPGERGEYYFKFNMDALLRGDSKARSEAYAAGRQWGWLSVNDIRELEDENPIGNGDIYLQPINMGEAGKAPPATPVPTQTPNANA